MKRIAEVVMVCFLFAVLIYGILVLVMPFIRNAG